MDFESRTGELTSPPQPAVLVPFFDSLFKSTVVRLPDPEKGVTAVPQYAKRQAWNADGTKLLLYGSTGGEWFVYHGTEYRLLKQLELERDGLDSEVLWANNRKEHCKTENETLYYRVGLSLMTTCANKDSSKRKATIRSAGADYIANGDEGSQADDDCRWAFFTGEKEKFNALDVVTYDICAGKQVATVSVEDLSMGKAKRGAHQAINWVSVSPSGKFVIVQWNYYGQTKGRGRGTDVFRFADLSFVAHLSDLNNHGDIGTLDGEDYFVMQGRTETQQDYRTINAWRLADGTRIDTVLPASWAPYSCCYHISMQGSRGSKGISGFMLLSMYTADGTRLGAKPGWGGDEMVACKIGTQECYRLGQLFNARAKSDKDCGTPGCSYWQEPHCAPSRDFKKAVCGSNWLDRSSPARAYVWTFAEQN